MANYSIEITANHTQEILDKIDRKVEAGLEACGIQCVTYATQNVNKGVPRHAESWYTPKGAAGLAGSISHLVKTEENAVYVGTNNEHAIYNEYGTGIYAENGRSSPWAYMGEDGNMHWTHGITPLHFLKHAVEDHKDQYKEIIEQYLSRD